MASVEGSYACSCGLEDLLSNFYYCQRCKCIKCRFVSYVSLLDQPKIVTQKTDFV